jgi:hypothetical protein
MEVAYDTSSCFTRMDKATQNDADMKQNLLPETLQVRYLIQLSQRSRCCRWSLKQWPSFKVRYYSRVCLKPGCSLRRRSCNTGHPLLYESEVQTRFFCLLVCDEINVLRSNQNLLPCIIFILTKYIKVFYVRKYKLNRYTQWNNKENPTKCTGCSTLKWTVN